MKSTTIRLSVALALLLPAVAWASEGATVRDGDAPTTTASTGVAAGAADPSTAPGAPASTQGVRNAISNAFRASDESVPCADGSGVGCTIAETALGSALFDEREEDRANQFLRER